MIDRVHTKYGHGFKGIAAYLLHDKDADTRQRVVWTETRNLSTNNPDAAWRVMAMTAMDQDRLKREAGIRPGGKPGKGPVLHLTLSWHAEEKDGLTKDEMLRAAYGALRAVKLEDRQALIVCHGDEPQPHAHIVVNRVSPKDGRLPKDYKDFDKLSRWAKKYEKERGKIYCDQRVINEKARDRGEYVRAQNNKPRHLIEMQQAINDNSAKKRLEEQHRKAAFAIKAEERRQQERHAKAWDLLQRFHKQRIAQIEDRTRHAIAKEKVQVRYHYRPQWDAQYHEHQAQLRKFEQDEARAIGRMKNALKLIDFRSLIGRQSENDDGKAKTIAQAFDLLGNAGARLMTLECQHTIQERALEAKQKGEEQTVTKNRMAEQQRFLAENRIRFHQERNDLILVQSMNRAKTKAAWLEKGRQMRKEWAQMKEVEYDAKVDPSPARAPDIDRQPANDDSLPVKTNPSNLLPKEGSDEAAKHIDQFVDRFQKRHDRVWYQGRDPDDDRER